jgi:hypothetical protein
MSVPKIPLKLRPGKSWLKIVAGGYLSMNAAAWLPRRSLPGPANASLKSATSAGDAAMIGHD